MKNPSTALIIGLGLLFLHTTNATFAAEITKGVGKQAVMDEWGAPKSYIKIGREETLIYPQNVRVFLVDGKVVGFKNRDKMSKGGEVTPAPSAAGQPAKTGTLSVPSPAGKTLAGPLEVPDLSSYRIPKPTLLSDPDYRVRGTWGGESDGKLIGVDGKPLADHHQYANDSYEFLNLLRKGIKTTVPENLQPTLQTLYPLHRSKTAEERKEWEDRYQAQYKKAAVQDPLYGLAYHIVQLEAACSRHDFEQGQINYEERLKFKDRVSLDEAPTPGGLERRKRMKQEIWRIEQHRKVLMAKYGVAFDAARGTKAEEDAKAAAADRFATIDKQDALMFMYSKFERTPMLEGLAQAAVGQVHEYAKPVLLPRGAKVQILESKEVDAPAGDDRPEQRLKVTRIRLKDPEVRQLNGAKLNMTLQGWTLDRNLAPASR